jgi:Zn-dependent M28 family amino/carboxypeptidase
MTRIASTTFAAAGVAVLLLATPLLAQSPADRLVSTELGTVKAFQTLMYLTDEIGPRPSGSKNAQLAVEWTTSQFKAWGIPVHNEPVKVPHWVRGAESATLVSHNDQRLILTALGGSVSTPPKGITADVVEVTSFDELKSLGDRVKGKVVFYYNPMDMAMVAARHSFEAYSKAVVFRTEGASRAASYGAVAVLIRSVGSASLRTPHTGAMRYDSKLPKIPAAALTAEDSLLVHRLLNHRETVRVHLQLESKMLPDVESANVVAEIRGSEKPDEIVVIGGHLDSWDLGTGAIDDGSGVAMVMETMRLIHELGLTPKRTIRCVLFMNEEFGLSGARAYFAAHKNEKHVAAVESDSGAAPPMGFTTTLKGDALTALEKRLGPLKGVNAATLDSQAETGADTSPLVEAGVTGFGFVPDPLHYFDYHHSPADTLDKVDPNELAQDSAAIAGLTWILADQ